MWKTILTRIHEPTLWRVSKISKRKFNFWIACTLNLTLVACVTLWYNTRFFSVSFETNRFGIWGFFHSSSHRYDFFIPGSYSRTGPAFKTYKRKMTSCITQMHMRLTQRYDQIHTLKQDFKHTFKEYIFNILNFSFPWNKPCNVYMHFKDIPYKNSFLFNYNNISWAVRNLPKILNYRITKAKHVK